MAQISSTRHSAKVRLSLQLADQIIPLSQAGHQLIRTRENINLPPQAAIILVDVDENRHERRVYLPEGVTGPNRNIPVRNLAENEAA